MSCRLGAGKRFGKALRACIGANVTRAEGCAIVSCGDDTRPVGISGDHFGGVCTVAQTACYEIPANFVVGQAGFCSDFSELAVFETPESEGFGEMWPVNIANFDKAVAVKVGCADGREPTVALANMGVAAIRPLGP